jgi:hypothetical protein
MQLRAEVSRAELEVKGNLPPCDTANGRSGTEPYEFGIKMMKTNDLYECTKDRKVGKKAHERMVRGPIQKKIHICN